MNSHSCYPTSATPSFLSITSLIGLLLVLNIGPYAALSTYAQATPPITSSDLSTVVTTNGNVHSITGGTRPANGPNLFHSFVEFGVPANNIANFLNETALPTSNILGRVTGDNPSSIFGTIQTTNFDNANLFLMNPAGILFGPSANLNVGGSVVFTTANSVRLFDGINSVTFYANPANDAVTTPGRVSILSAAPLVDFGFVTPAAFGFLDPTPAAITVQGSTLSVNPGQSISFVGGDFTMTGGSLEALGSQVRIASLASAGEILHQDLGTGPNINGDTFTGMGTINLSQGAVVDVSANAAGTIRIRGGQFVIADATLSANTGNTNGAPVAIDINATEDLSIMDTRAMSAITATTSGTGDAGAVQISAANVEASTTSQESFALIDTHTLGDGRAGNVTVATHAESAVGSLLVSGTVTTGFRFIDSGTRGPGTGGDVTLTAKNIDLNQTTISTGDFVARQLLIDPSGSAGNLTIIAESLQGSDFIFSTEAFAAIADTQQGGNITITGRQNTPATINLLNGQVGAGGMARGGDITFTNFDSLFTDFTFFETFTTFGPGGGITANGRAIELTNGSKLVATTFGDGDAGNISLTATDHVNLLGQTPANPNAQSVFSPTGIFSNSFGDFGLGNLGASGSVEVTTPRLVMDTGGRINAITNSSGRGGNVTVNADVVSISGEFASPEYIIESSIVDIGDFRPSGIFTKTIGSGESCTEGCGEGGNITLTVGLLSMGPGSQIDSGTSSTGNGGNITVNARETLSMSGTLNDGSPVGIFSRAISAEPDAGSGGNITLTAGQSVSILNGASVSANSTGPGDAGNISIDAGQQFDMRNSSVRTEAAQASGGNIDIQAVNQIRLVDSTISTSVLGGAGSGGNITIDPNIVVLQNSNVIAQAVQGAGGNITITTPLFLSDQSSLVSASSQFGLNGPVTIQGPTSNLSGSVGTLPSDPSQAQNLLTQRCAALANGQASSFVVAGREQLPSDPGGWLTSPLYATGVGEGQGVRGKGLEGLSTNEGREADTQILSLRRLTPARFLIANFADSEATGCHS